MLLILGISVVVGFSGLGFIDNISVIISKREYIVEDPNNPNVFNTI